MSNLDRMTSYIGNEPISKAAGYRTEFIATAGQTTFTVSYAIGYVDVFVNGVKLANADFTATNGSSVTLAESCDAGDVVAFIAWATGTMLPTENFYTKSQVDAALVPLTLTASAVKAASGTAVEFTGIPSWVKRITLMFFGLSGSGNSAVHVQLGTASGYETTGYNGSVTRMTGSSITTAVLSAGFSFDTNAETAASSRHGQLVLSRVGGNDWVAHGINGDSGINRLAICGGGKALAAALDRVRIATVNGTDTFDAGSVSILYE